MATSNATIRMMNTDMNIHIDTKYLTDHGCSYEEKLDCIKTLKTILKFYKSHKFDLQYSIDDYELPKLFKIGITLLKCNEPLDYINRIMYNYIASGKYRGKQLLESIIVIELINAIYQEFDVYLIDRYISYFGLDFIQSFQNLYIDFDYLD